MNAPCETINYVNLLTHANAVGIGYLYWVWYEDSQCSPDVNAIPPGQPMNITLGTYGNGVTLPTAANPGYPYDALYHPGFGIDTAVPATVKADFSPVGAALLNTSFAYDVTSSDDNVTRPATALVTRLNNFGAEKRPVVVLMPGWGGAGDMAATRDAQATMLANHGYVALSIGFHQTNAGNWNSDLAESAKAALGALCAQAYADCSAVILTGQSYGGTQVHPVVRYLRAGAVFDGSGGANAGRKVVGILGQDSGYTLYWTAPVNADATAYSIAMIENLGDGDFPVDSCAWNNCGARNRADYHQAAPGSQYVLSFCPAGGAHGSRGYADWDAWVLSAVKTMLHDQRGVPKFAGYVEPTVAVSNACLSAALPTATPTSLSFGGQSMHTTSASTTVTLTNTGTGTLTISAVAVTPASFAQTNDCATLGAAASCTVTLTFTPAIEGAISGSLTFANSAGTVTVPVSGTGERSLVTHYYHTILGRAPDLAGRSFWDGEAARLSALGVNVNETWFVMAGYFFSSAEYLAANKTNDQFVADLYNTFFNRLPDAGGQAYWVGQIVGGLPPGGGALLIHVLQRVPHLHAGHLRQHRGSPRGGHGARLLPRAAQSATGDDRVQLLAWPASHRPMRRGGSGLCRSRRHLGRIHVQPRVRQSRAYQHPVRD